MDGKLLHFSCGGLYDGLFLLRDDETGTYWHHVTGEALHGPLAGKKLETWSLPITTADAALTAYPDIRIHLSRPGWFGQVFAKFFGPFVFGNGLFPPGFRKTFGPADKRLPALAHGLGVVAGGRAVFYPADGLRHGARDSWDGRTLRIEVGPDGVPAAVWLDGTRPFQLFLRWYGFSYSYPGCEIHSRAELHLEVEAV